MPPRRPARRWCAPRPVCVTSSSMSISSSSRLALDHALHDTPHPARALAAGRALAAALVHVEVARAARSPSTMSVDLSMTMTAAVPRPERCLAQRCRNPSARCRRSALGRQRHRRAAWDHRQQVVPAAAHAAACLIDELLERDAHLLFDVAGLVHMAGDAEQLGAGILRPADARRTTRRHGAGWSAPPRWSRRC